MLASGAGGSAAEGLSHRRTSFRGGTTEAYATIATVTSFRALALIVAAVALAGCGSHHRARSASGSPTTIGVSATRVTTPRCASSGLEVWLGLGEGGGTAGSTFYPLELSNVSSHACHLSGFPGVSAYRGHQLGAPAQRDHSHPAQTVNLARGDTAHAILRITDVGNIAPSKCKPVTAAELKVFPPNERAARFVPFSFRACSRPGTVFLSVGPVEPGVGIPGHST